MKLVTLSLWGLEREVIDLGGDHWFSWLVATDGPDSEPPGQTGSGWYKHTPDFDAGPKPPFGAYDIHLNEAGSICCGYISWEPYGAMKASGHTLVSHDPIEISPSLACRACSSHGFIREGSWISC